MKSRLMEYFNRQPRIGSIGKADRDGRTDVAVMGSPRMIDDRTGVLGSGTYRTLEDLRRNPHAVFMIVEPGPEVTDWRGVRAYMTAREIATAGRAFDAFMDEVARAAGEDGRARLQVLVTFDVTVARPIIDIGQRSERSI